MDCPLTGLIIERMLNMKLLACCFVIAVVACAQSKSAPKAQESSSQKAPEKVALDKPKLEAYLRYLELWVPDVNVKIDDPKPLNGMPGFSVMSVHLSYKAASVDETY